MSVYIVSAMLALVLAIISKKLRRKWTVALGVLHILFLLAFIIFNYIIDSDVNSAYYFLAFFSSGLLLFGLVIRNKFNILLKIYSSLFICSVLVFVVKPSLVLTFITQTAMPVEIEYKLGDNMYLVKQDPLLKKERKEITFKVSKKLGSFHRTLARNIYFKNAFDSLNVVSINDTTIIINTFLKEFNSITNSNVLIDLTKIKKRDNANIQQY